MTTGPNFITAETGNEPIQLVTFSVSDIVLGIDIAYVQEINRHLEITPVPEANNMIHGVVNLRGDVVTVLNPHKIFDRPATCPREKQRNLILNVQGERIGFLVDKVSDIMTVRPSQLSRRPSNVRNIDRKFIESVLITDEHVVVIVSATSLMNAVDQTAEANKKVA